MSQVAGVWPGEGKVLWSVCTLHRKALFSYLHWPLNPLPSCVQFRAVLPGPTVAQAVPGLYAVCFLPPQGAVTARVWVLHHLHASARWALCFLLGFMLTGLPPHFWGWNTPSGPSGG